tara:strand:- start:151 stop:504 length:354 start_codon:yes stop_codon:yes gene_type:complete
MIIHWYCLDDFISDFLAVRDNFSREGLTLLFEYYDSIGEPIEFDPIAMCCDWSEYSDPLEALEEVGGLDEFESLEAFYLTLTYEGSTPAEALEEVLGTSVLWDGDKCFLIFYGGAIL